MKTLRLQLPPLAELGADSALHYEALDDQRIIVERGQAVPAALPRLQRTELVVPASDVLLVEAQVPPLSGARLRAALPAIAEPHVLSGVDAIYVVASRAAGDRATLAVLDRALFARALELLRRAKIEPASATAEQLTLPLRDGRWRLRLGDTHGCLRSGQMRGTACSLSRDGQPPVELQLALQQADPPPAGIDVEGACDVEAWSAMLAVPVSQAPPAAQAEAAALELLQYEFAPQLFAWRAWRVPAALAAALALTWLIGLNVDAWMLRREESALRGRMEAVLRQAFPTTGVILDPLKQMQRGVADLRAGTGTADPQGFLPLAVALGRVLAADSEAVRALEFRDQTLRVDFDPRALEQPRKRDLLVDSMTAAGLTARFTDSTLSVRMKGDGS